MNIELSSPSPAYRALVEAAVARAPKPPAGIADLVAASMDLRPAPSRRRRPAAA